MADNRNPKCPEIWFSEKGYWMRVAANRYLNLGTSDLRLMLRGEGFYDGKVDGGGLNPVEMILRKTILERFVDYAGPLAGHRVGLFETSSGKRFLVTSEANPAVFEKPTAKSDDCPFIEKFVSTLLGPKQQTQFLLWLKFAMASLRRGDFRPGQMVVLAGGPGCGKGLIHHLITELLGGRSAKPYLWMSGKTNFNEDIVGAESLIIEDERGNTSISARREFASMIKQLTVNETIHIHGKGKKGELAPSFRRLHLSVNWEVENLAVLPPMDEDMLGKHMLLECFDAQKVISEDRTENRERIASEIPAFRLLLEKLTAPKSMRCPRFGVTASHSHRLLQAVNALAPELRLLELIDEVILSRRPGESRDKFEDRLPDGVWNGRAGELELELRGTSYAFVVEAMTRVNQNAIGTYLARLASKFPDRVSSTVSKGATRWHIARQRSE